MAFAEVEKFLDTPVKRYSSGMYVRLALWKRSLLQSLSWNMTYSTGLALWNTDYSTGLAFAVAAHRSAERSRRSLEPEILLVDESLS